MKRSNRLASYLIITVISAILFLIPALKAQAMEMGLPELGLTDLGQATTGTPIIINQTVSGTLATTDPTDPNSGSHYDLYTFTANAGQRVAVTMDSTQFNTYLVLYNDSEYRVLDDNGGGGTNSRIPASSGYVTLTAGGTYYICAAGTSPSALGSYTLKLFEPPFTVSGHINQGRISQALTQPVSGSKTTACEEPELAAKVIDKAMLPDRVTSVPISIGQTINGTLTADDPTFADGSHYDFYSFTAEAGQQVAVTMTSTDFDTFLCCDGYQDDNGGGGTNARIPPNSGYITLTGGTHYIYANASTASDLGSYTLSLISGPVVGVTLTFEKVSGIGSVPATVQTQSDGSWTQTGFAPGASYRVTPSKAGYTFTPVSLDFNGACSNLDFLVQTFPVSGHITTDGSGSQVIAQPASGSNTTANEEPGLTGKVIDKAMLPDRVTSVLISIGQTINGTLTADDPALPDGCHYDLYIFAVAAGQQVAITMNSTDFNAYLCCDVYQDDNGGGGTNARIPPNSGYITLSEGMWYIYATASTASDLGSYTLTLAGSVGGGPRLPLRR